MSKTKGNVVACMVTLILGAVAFAAPRADGSEVSGTGSGHVDLGGEQHFVTFNVSAHTGPRGDYGSCRLTFEGSIPPVDVHVNVDCLNAFPQAPGAGAWVAGVVKKVTPTPNSFQINPGDRMYFFVTDYGNPGSMPADQIGVFFSPPIFIDCETQVAAGGAPIETGNINISLGN